MLDEVRKVLDEEIQKAAQELQEEQRQAIKHILEEHKAAIRQVVEEEKKSIWEKAEMLRQSILKMGLRCHCGRCICGTAGKFHYSKSPKKESAGGCTEPDQRRLRLERFSLLGFLYYR